MAPSAMRSFLPLVPGTFVSRKNGFTLVEMAIVLVIVGLLVEAYLTHLTEQMELRNNDEKEAVIQNKKQQ